MNRLLIIQKPQIQSFQNSQYKEIINGHPIHDTNIESYRKNNDFLVRGHIDNKPIYYDSRQKHRNTFRNKKHVSFTNPIYLKPNLPIIRDVTPFYPIKTSKNTQKKIKNKGNKKMMNKADKNKKVKSQKKRRN